jgi:hypothetical protein
VYTPLVGCPEIVVNGFPGLACREDSASWIAVERSGRAVFIGQLYGKAAAVFAAGFGAAPGLHGTASPRWFRVE